MSDIVTLTLNPAIDITFPVDQVVPERKIRGGEPSREAGGGGINVARAVVKLGGEAKALYLGGGPTGEMLAGLVAAELKHSTVIPISGWTRENLIVSEKTSGQQFRFTLPGPTLKDSECQNILDAVRALEPRPRYLVASGSLPPGVPEDFYARLGEVAREIGSRYVLDTSGRPLQIAIQAGGVFLAKPNQREMEQLVAEGGGDGESGEMDASELGRRIVGNGWCEVIMLSLGRAGARLITSDVVRTITPPTVPFKSAVGAGDSMVGGILYALSRGMSIEDAALYGVAAGTAATMTPGTELCRREDAERLFEGLRRQ